MNARQFCCQFVTIMEDVDLMVNTASPVDLGSI